MNYIKKTLLAFSIISILSTYANAKELEVDPKFVSEEGKVVQEIISRQLPYPQYEMATRYFSGTGGVTQNYQKAMYWLLGSSKDEENPAADSMIALMFFEGIGTPKNEIEGLKYYHLAAQKGSSEAQIILASIYFFNANFMDKENAYLYFNEALKNNNKYAYMLKSVMDLNDNDKESMKKIIPAMELNVRNDEYSQFLLGYLYMTGKIVGTPDINKAEKLFKLSALKNNPISIVLQRELQKVIKVEDSKEENKNNIK